MSASGSVRIAAHALATAVAVASFEVRAVVDVKRVHAGPEAAAGGTDSLEAVLEAVPMQGRGRVHAPHSSDADAEVRIAEEAGSKAERDSSAATGPEAQIVRRANNAWAVAGVASAAAVAAAAVAACVEVIDAAHSTAADPTLDEAAEAERLDSPGAVRNKERIDRSAAEAAHEDRGREQRAVMASCTRRRLAAAEDERSTRCNQAPAEDDTPEAEDQRSMLPVAAGPVTAASSDSRIEAEAAGRTIASWMA